MRVMITVGKRAIIWKKVSIDIIIKTVDLFFRNCAKPLVTTVYTCSQALTVSQSVHYFQDGFNMSSNMSSI